jgi:hypothetical protein
MGSDTEASTSDVHGRSKKADSDCVNSAIPLDDLTARHAEAHTKSVKIMCAGAIRTIN